MPAAITIGGTGPFQFCAAHAGLHDGEFEPLHGHTFTVTLRLQGELDDCGMLADFQAVKKALTGAIKPLRRRTLMPAQMPGCDARMGVGQVQFQRGRQVHGRALPTGISSLS